MFDEPEEAPSESARNPADRAREKSDELRMHAELAAVFEGPRKFDAQIVPNLSADLARQIQRGMAKLEKSKSPEHPVLPPESSEEALGLLNLPETQNLSTNDYHIHRRPGEVMMVRWLAGDQVESFYERLQAHFDAALAGTIEDEKSQAWRQDPQTLAYLDALEKLDLKMAERYLREPIKTHPAQVLSTQTADEININYLADHIMNTPAAEIVGDASAPPDDAPTEKDLAWFFKLFSLRASPNQAEKMCFFAYLQKTDDDGW